MFINGNQTVTFQRATESGDALGVPTKSHANITGLVNVTATINPISAAQRSINEKYGYLASHRVLINYPSTPPEEGDRCIWNGSNFTVTFVRDPNNEKSHLEVDIYLYA